MHSRSEYSRGVTAACLVVIFVVAGIAGIASAPGLLAIDAVHARPVGSADASALLGVSSVRAIAPIRTIGLVSTAALLAAAFAAATLSVAHAPDGVSALSRVSSPLRI